MPDKEEVCRGLAGGLNPTGHIPVLVEKVLSYLAPRAGGRYLDATLGLGGHAHAILERTGGDAMLLGMDRDERALARAGERLAGYGDRVRLAQSPFSRVEACLDEVGWDLVDGAMADLGVSSLQLDEAERGFSFLRDGPLDMRMGTIEGLPPASRLVNTASFEELKRIFGRLGEEPMGGRIARTIVDARAQKPIESTAELAGLVEKAYGKARAAKARLHPATRTFMALRMAVNHELEELEIFLERILDRLRPGGRLVVISFHSLEDRMVKHTLRREASDCLCPPRQPLCTCGHRARVRVLTKKPVMAGEEEVEANPRSRGAKLRAAERLPQSGSEEGGR